MQSSSRTFVSVVGTVSMVVMTIVLAAVSPEHKDQQAKPASIEQQIAVSER
jgi:hypothetical protein